MESKNNNGKTKNEHVSCIRQLMFQHIFSLQRGLKKYLPRYFFNPLFFLVRLMCSYFFLISLCLSVHDVELWLISHADFVCLYLCV